MRNITQLFKESLESLFHAALRESGLIFLCIMEQVVITNSATVLHRLCRVLQLSLIDYRIGLRSITALGPLTGVALFLEEISHASVILYNPFGENVTAGILGVVTLFFITITFVCVWVTPETLCR